MRLAEVDGKAVLRRHGLAIPRGLLLRSGARVPVEIAQWSPVLLLKAQLLEGGRGKRGLVRRVDNPAAVEEARSLITAAIGDEEIPLLLEETVAIAREIYAAVCVDGTRQTLELLLAPEGGEQVETTDSLIRLPVDAPPVTAETLYARLAQPFGRSLAARLARYCARLPEIARHEDLELLEINPLALTPTGSLVACDAKLIRDDSADFRHDPEEFPVSRMLAERAMTPLERRAHGLGFELVEAAGDVALVTAGAGLGMMMMDLLADHGLRAACFMDNRRGAPDETMAERLQIARMLAERRDVRAIVFQTVLASRSLAERIDALLEWLQSQPLPKPLFVGIAAGHAAARQMSAEQAVAKLAAVGVAAFTDPIALVRAAAAAVGGKIDLDPRP